MQKQFSFAHISFSTILIFSLMGFGCGNSGETKNKEEVKDKPKNEEVGDYHADVEPADVNFEYGSYFNNRFGFCASFPIDYLFPQGQSDNGDGQTFLTADGKSVMLAYSGYALDRTVGEVYAEESRGGTYGDRKRVVTYKVLKDDWYVVSGKENGKIFYKKEIWMEDKIHGIFFEYPESAASEFKVIVTKVAGAFPSC